MPDRDRFAPAGRCAFWIILTRLYVGVASARKIRYALAMRSVTVRSSRTVWVENLGRRTPHVVNQNISCARACRYNVWQAEFVTQKEEMVNEARPHRDNQNSLGSVGQTETVFNVAECPFRIAFAACDSTSHRAAVPSPATVTWFQTALALTDPQHQLHAQMICRCPSMRHQRQRCRER